MGKQVNIFWDHYPPIPWSSLHDHLQQAVLFIRFPLAQIQLGVNTAQVHLYLSNCISAYLYLLTVFGSFSVIAKLSLPLPASFEVPKPSSDSQPPPWQESPKRSTFMFNNTDYHDGQWLLPWEQRDSWNYQKLWMSETCICSKVAFLSPSSRSFLLMSTILAQDDV